ncbi:MAG: hypothetical protein IJ344_02655 [Clostridia bacterium]|nr:hypothetical protein [Clostridia bacterium]
MKKIIVPIAVCVASVLLILGIGTLHALTSDPVNTEEEAIEIAQAYVTEHYGEQFEDYTVHASLEGEIWCVSWAPSAMDERTLLGGGGPLVQIKSENGTVVSCLLQK